jgi:hypothetical protein
MLTTYTEILKIVSDDLANIQDHPFVDDALTEYADSEVPVYNSDIVEEWRELPYNSWDSGRDLRDHDSGILDLMRYDLYTYYNEQFYRAYQQLTEEQD